MEKWEGFEETTPTIDGVAVSWCEFAATIEQLGDWDKVGDVVDGLELRQHAEAGGHVFELAEK